MRIRSIEAGVQEVPRAVLTSNLPLRPLRLVHLKHDGEYTLSPSSAVCPTFEYNDTFSDCDILCVRRRVSLVRKLIFKRATKNATLDGNTKVVPATKVCLLWNFCPTDGVLTARGVKRLAYTRMVDGPTAAAEPINSRQLSWKTWGAWYLSLQLNICLPWIG